MSHTYKDRVIKLWPSLTSLDIDRNLIAKCSAECLATLFGHITFDLARFADGGTLLRPDLVAELCHEAQQSSLWLNDKVLDVRQRSLFLGLLEYVIHAPNKFLIDEARTPWDDNDLRLFAVRASEKSRLANFQLA